WRMCEPVCPPVRSVRLQADLFRSGYRLRARSALRRVSPKPSAEAESRTLRTMRERHLAAIEFSDASRTTWTTIRLANGRADTRRDRSWRAPRWRRTGG